nr:MAG TPA: hypothetical protein [Caudoviricetes sp.]
MIPLNLFYLLIPPPSCAVRRATHSAPVLRRANFLKFLKGGLSRRKRGESCGN